MQPTYYIYLFTLLGGPVFGFLTFKFLKISKLKAVFFLLFTVFSTHIICYKLNYSLKGDHADYIVFSLAYIFLCCIVFLLFQLKGRFVKILRIVGSLGIALGLIKGLFGILFFIITVQDYEADKVYNINFDNQNYEIRRYSFGFATLDDIRYTFKTYKELNGLPIEQMIDKSDFFDNKSEMDFRDENFKVQLSKPDQEMVITFSSANEKSFSKPLK